MSTIGKNTPSPLSPDGLARWVLLTALIPALASCGKSMANSGEAQHPAGASARPVSLASHTHENPDETCFICDPSKRDTGRLWCKEHARYEDRCWLCHPELEEKDRLYCEEHGLYEDECHLCHPEWRRTKADAAGAGDTPNASAGLFCNAHGVPEIECAICQPELAASLKPGENLKVRFPSAEAADKVGVRTGRARSAETLPGIAALCEVQYNLNELARVTPLAAGVVRNVRRDVGNHVEAGEILAELHSVSAASAKSDYLAAIVEEETRRQAFERESRLKEQQIAAEKDFIAAHAAYRAARLRAKTVRQKLVNYGFTEAEIETIERTQDTSARLVVRAPFAGEIIERNAVAGEAVDIGDALFTVANLSSRWLMMSVPASRIGHIRPGQLVEARFDALPNVTFTARITWVDTAIDPRTRLVRARALITENSEALKTGLFGEAVIYTGHALSGVRVPRDAVQRHEGREFVFGRDKPELFALRRVELGASEGDTAHIVAGLTPQETVVTEGSFIVMSEFLKSRLGAGCVHE